METQTELLGLAAAAAYYLFFLVGSVSLGYAFLRLTQPEIRASPRQRKLVFSLAVGAAFVLAAAALEYVVYGDAGVERLLGASGMTPLFALAATAVCLAVFQLASRIKSVLRAKRTMEIAVAAPPEKQGAARLLPFVQEVRKTEAQPVAEAGSAAEIEAGGMEPPLVESFKEPSENERELKREPDAAPNAPPWVKQEPPSLPSLPSRKSVREKLAELKAKGVVEEEKAIAVTATTAAAAKPDATPKPVLSPDAGFQEFQELKIETPKIAVAPPALPTAPAALPTTKEKESVVTRVFGKPRYGPKTEQPQAAPTQATRAAQAPQPTPQSVPQPTQATRAPPAAPTEKKGLLQKIFGGGSKKEIPSTAPFAAGAAGGSAQGGGATTAPRAAPPKKPVSEEGEIEVILSELHLIKAPTPIARKPLPFKPGRARTMQQAAAATAPEEGPAQRHRLYLERRGGAGGGGGAGSARTRLEQERADKQELNELFSDVYSQVEKPGKPGAARSAAQRGAAARGVAAGGGASGAGAGDKPLSMNDLFGAETGAAAKAGEAKAEAAGAGAGGGAAGGSSIFSQLESLNEPSKQSEASAAAQAGAAPQVQTVKMQVSSAAGCPHCGAKNVRIVFCPYCGSGMCANCTPALKPTQEAFVYTCVKCGEEVPVYREKKT